MSEKSRKAFEAWIIHGGDSPFKSWNSPRADALHENGEYWYGPIQGAWIAYQASRAAALEDAAKVCEDVADEYNRSEGGKWPELKSDAQSGASACENAIRSLASSEQGDKP